MILKQALGGNCKTELVVTCSQEKANADQTLSALRFGVRCGNIRNGVATDARYAATLHHTTSLTHSLIRCQQITEAAHCRGAPLDCRRSVRAAGCSKAPQACLACAQHLCTSLSPTYPANAHSRRSPLLPFQSVNRITMAHVDSLLEALPLARMCITNRQRRPLAVAVPLMAPVVAVVDQANEQLTNNPTDSSEWWHPAELANRMGAALGPALRAVKLEYAKAAMRLASQQAQLRRLGSMGYS